MAATEATTALTCQDYFSTTLSSGITSTTTTISLASLPTGTEGFLVIDPDNSSKEIIFYNNTGGGAVTVPSTDDRGRGGTTAVSHSSGATVKMHVVADYWKKLQSGVAITAGAITPNKLQASTGTTWAWTSAVPTITASTTAPTINDSTLIGYYKQIGKTVIYHVQLTIGSNFVVGSGTYRFSLPVAVNTTSFPGNSSLMIAGTVTDLAPELGLISGGKLISSTTTEIICGKASTFGTLGHAFPFAWATGDSVDFTVIYEAA